MKKLQLIAILIATLITTIPVATAQELNVVVSGKDGAKNFARPQDTLTIRAQAGIPGETIISKDQVRVYVEESFAFFDNCTKMGESGTHNCIFEDDSFGSYNPVAFDVELRNDDDRVLLKQRHNLKIDSSRPSIQEFNITPLTGTGPVTLKYVVMDYGTDTSKPQDCSGVKSIELTLDSQPVFSETGQLGTCVKEKSTQINLNQSGKICLLAKDYVNQESPRKCLNVIIDTNPPTIEQPQIVNADGTAITHVRKGEEKLATVSIRITDDSAVDQKQVFANLAGISPAFTDFTAPSQFSGNLAVWKNVPLAETGSCKITAKAKDKLGQESSKEFSCSLRADNVGPTFSRVVSVRQRDNIPLYGNNSAITLEFIDKDSTGSQGQGMARRLAYLDLSELGLGKFVQASTCLPDGEKWQCTWNLAGITKPEGVYDISFPASTADDLGNPLQNTSGFKITYDNTPPATPRIISQKVLKGEEKSNISSAVAGNFVQFVLTSSNFTDAYADFSEFGGKTDQKGVCGETDNGTIECTFDGKIELDGPYTAQTSFIFLDDAGNNASTTASVEVYGIDNATTGRYWTATTDCSPKLIDRAAASTFPPVATCKINLKTPRKDITPLSISGADPTQCGALNQTLVLNDAYLTNTRPGTTTPFLNLKLEAKDYYVDQLNITCPITVVTQRKTANGSFVSPTPQVIPIRANFQFYNFPEQDMYGEIDRLIEDSMNDALASQDWLGIANKFMHYVNIICQLKSLITNALQILDIVTIVVGLSAETARNSVVGSPAYPGLTAIKNTLCGTGDGLVKAYTESIAAIIDPFCSIVNCNMGDKSSWGVPGIGTGGGATYCQDLVKWFNELIIPDLGLGAESFFNNFQEETKSFQIKDSIVWSAACVCIPGIIHNVEKLRQIQCYKAVCLNDKVKTEGYPVSTCDEMYNYFLCQYVIGQIFALFPFATFFEKIVDLLVDVITDPVAAITAIVSLFCLPFCYVDTTPPMIFCMVPRGIALVGEAVAAVYQMTKTKGYFSTPPGAQYCKRMEKIKEELEEDEKKE